MPAGELITRPPEAGRAPAARLLVALAVLLGILCAIGGRSAISRQSAFSEYLTQARRCVELADCPSRGGRTGALPIFHGASWIRLLAYSLRTGTDQTRVQSIILGSWIVSLPILFVFLKRYLGLRAAALALGLYFPVILVGTDITNFTYTNLLPLPWTVYYFGIALFVEFRRGIFAAAASVALAAAVSAEMGSIVMVPFHFLLVVLAARRPLLALAGCALFFAVPFCLDSMDAARAIARQVPTVRFAVGVAISGGAAALATRMLPRRHFTATSVTDRVRTVMTAALLYAAIAMFLACQILMHDFPAPRYFLPASFPFLYLVAERLGAVGTRATIVAGVAASLGLLLLPLAPHALHVLQVPVMVVVTCFACETLVRMAGRGPRPVPRSLWPVVTVYVCAIGMAVGDFVVLSKRGASQELTLADAEGMVIRLYAAGHTYAELLGSLQGPAADDVMSLLTERDPRVFHEPPPRLRAADFSILLLKVPATVVSRTPGVVAAVPTDASRLAIAVRGERAYLDWTRMRRCRWAIEGWRPTAYLCAEPRPDHPVPHNWPYVEFGDPHVVPDARPPERARDYWSVHYEVPVRTPGHGTPHIVAVANEWPATWRIVRVSGVEFTGTLPAAEVRLTDRQVASGIVEFEYTGVIPGDLPWVWLPHAMEVAQDNAHLLAASRTW